MKIETRAARLGFDAEPDETADGLPCLWISASPDDSEPAGRFIQNGYEWKWGRVYAGEDGLTFRSEAAAGRYLASIANEITPD